MRKQLITVFGLLLSATTFSAGAQSIWNRTHLDEVKPPLDRPMYAEAYSALLRQAGFTEARAESLTFGVSTIYTARK
ncbi:MAG: hypothetical protein K2M71_03075 [Duncaniella sp.]|nr:hypothetical protein [Duncaniella sp.]